MTSKMTKNSLEQCHLFQTKMTGVTVEYCGRWYQRQRRGCFGRNHKSPVCNVTILVQILIHWRRQLWSTGARAPPRLPTV